MHGEILQKQRPQPARQLPPAAQRKERPWAPAAHGQTPLLRGWARCVAACARHAGRTADAPQPSSPVRCAVALGFSSPPFLYRSLRNCWSVWHLSLDSRNASDGLAGLATTHAIIGRLARGNWPLHHTIFCCQPTWMSSYMIHELFIITLRPHNCALYTTSDRLSPEIGMDT